MKFVVVVWEDSTHVHFGWSPLNDVADMFDNKVVIFTPGIVIEETDHYIAVAQSMDNSRSALSNSLKIPKSQILEIIDFTSKIKGKFKKYEVSEELFI